MKESKLIEMQNKTESLGRVLQAVINELEMIKTMVMGDHEVIKRLDQYDDIINQLKKEVEDGKETDTSGSTSGSSGAFETD